MHRARLLILLLAGLLAACTMRSAIQTMTSEEDRAFAQEMVDRLRTADADWLQGQFDTSLWEQSAKQVGQAPDLYPEVPGETDIISFSVSSGTTNGSFERRKEFTLVTHGGGRWTVTHFRTLSTGGPDRVVEWRVTPHSAPPPELTMIETWDRMVPFVWAGVLIVLIGVGALIFWLVRRSRRRKRDPLMGGTGGAT
jgi:hypothetical protein